jgi:hypothetical protein
MSKASMAKMTISKAVIAISMLREALTFLPENLLRVIYTLPNTQ